jgi:hypothetical protein
LGSDFIEQTQQSLIFIEKVFIAPKRIGALRGATNFCIAQLESKELASSFDSAIQKFVAPQSAPMFWLAYKIRTCTQNWMHTWTQNCGFQQGFFSSQKSGCAE